MIPHVTKGRRLSKIETLTLAKNYIVALTDVICAMRNEERPEAQQTSVSEPSQASSDDERLEQSAVRVNIASRSCGSETQNFYQSNHSRWEDDRNNSTGLWNVQEAVLERPSTNWDLFNEQRFHLSSSLNRACLYVQEISYNKELSFDTYVRVLALLTTYSFDRRSDLKSWMCAKETYYSRQ